MNTNTVRNQLSSLFCAALLGAAAIFCIGAATSNGKVWEYKVVSGDVMITEGADALGPKINRAAETGWEAVSSAQAADHWGFVVMRRERK